MRPDLHDAFLRALDRGPAHLADARLAGEHAAQMRGMRAYANTISHARHVALEESFARTREAMGAEAFHAAALAFLAQPRHRGRPIRDIGSGFAETLAGPGERDLARVEWAWLAAYGARDCPAVLLKHLAGLSPGELIASRVTRHPASQLVPLEAPELFRWEAMPPSDKPVVLLTRPDRDVVLTRLEQDCGGLPALAQTPVTLGDLLDRHPDGVAALLEAGAFTPRMELL